MNFLANMQQIYPSAGRLLAVLVSEVKNQILSTSHALAAAGLAVNLSNLTSPLSYARGLACDC